MLVDIYMKRELTKEEQDHLHVLKTQDNLEIRCMDRVFPEEELIRLTEQADCNKMKLPVIICISDDGDFLRKVWDIGLPVITCLGGTEGSEQAGGMMVGHYAVENLCALDREYLETVYCRKNGIPRRIVTTRRLEIRELCPADLDMLMEIYDGNEKTPFFQSFYENREEAEAYLNHYIENVYDFYGYGIWGICLKPSFGNMDADRQGMEEPIIGIMGFTPREDALELGYALQKQYQGRGFVTEAKKALMEYAENVLNCHNIIIVRAD